MSKINPKRAYAKEIIENFDGIGARGEALHEGEQTPVNFRIREDGSLEKRCGWRVYESFDEGKIRGIWQGILNGEALRFAVCGNGVLQITSNRRIKVATLATNTGAASFFCFCSTLYLMDGHSIYVWDSRLLIFRKAEGYVPLYGQNWDPISLGEVHENLNLFTNRIRVHYYTRDAATQFRLPFYAQSVDFVRADGKETTAYTLSATLDSITLQNAASRLEIGFTVYLETETQEELRAATLAYVTNLASAERLLLYGTARGQYLYMGAAVSDMMLFAARSVYKNSDTLYFREADVMIVGSAESPVTTVCRDRQRLLAFHRFGASVISFPDGEEPEYHALNGIPGCTVPGMDVAVSGEHYILSTTGFFRLAVDDALSDGLRAIPIDVSLPTNDPALLSRMQVAYDPLHGEIWFLDPEDIDGCVHIYRPGGNRFYRFDNVHASRALTVDGLFGFLSGNDLCVFEEHLTTDAGLPFAAVAKTGWLHFGTPEQTKRSLRASLLARSGDELVLTLESEHRQCEVSQATGGFSAHLMDARVPLGRFRLLRAAIRDESNLRPRITRLALYANL